MEKSVSSLWKNKKFLLLLIIALLIATSGGSLLSVGTITGYQGLQPTFESVYFKNHLYKIGLLSNPNYINSDTKLPFIPSAFENFDHLNFDPDSYDQWRPNLKMSMQPITVNTEWPPKDYTWQLKTQSGVEEDGKIYDIYKQYQIQEFRCVWSVNLWCDGSGNEAYNDENHWYFDTQVWVKLVPNRFVYYQDNPDNVFFAPVYIGLSEDAVWRSGENNPSSGAIDNEMAGLQDIFPEAKGEVMGIFYAERGAEVNVEQTVLSYQDKALDPNIFRDEYWIRFGAERMGAIDWWGFPNVWDHYWKYPSANLQFQVNIFVVGEWTVKLETGDVPELEPRIPYYQYMDWLWLLRHGLETFFTSPFTYIWLIAIVVILYFVARIFLGVKTKGVVT